MLQSLDSFKVNITGKSWKTVDFIEKPEFPVEFQWVFPSLSLYVCMYIYIYIYLQIYIYIHAYYIYTYIYIYKDRYIVTDKYSILEHFSRQIRRKPYLEQHT